MNNNIISSRVLCYVLRIQKQWRTEKLMECEKLSFSFFGMNDTSSQPMRLLYEPKCCFWMRWFYKTDFESTEIIDVVESMEQI